MVNVAQLVEHQIVVLRVVGSIPIFHPKNVINENITQLSDDFCNKSVFFFVSWFIEMLSFGV